MITGADGQRLKMLGAFAGRDFMPFEFLGFYTGDLLEFEDGEGPRRTEDWSREIQNTVTGDSPPITQYTHILSHWLTYTLQIHYPPPPFSYLIHIHPLPGCLPPTQGETTNRLHISFECGILCPRHAYVCPAQSRSRGSCVKSSVMECNRSMDTGSCCTANYPFWYQPRRVSRRPEDSASAWSATRPPAPCACQRNARRLLRQRPVARRRMLLNAEIGNGLAPDGRGRWAVDAVLAIR